MNPNLIFLPSVTLVFLCYAVLLFLFLSRVAGMKKHRAGLRELADPKREAEIFFDARNPSDNFENLFEMPVLFFAAGLVIYVLGRVDMTYLVGAWLYVALRVCHSYVHCTSNRVKYRLRFFAASAAVLLWIWVRIGLQILKG